MKWISRLTPLLLLPGLSACDQSGGVPSRKERAAALMQHAIDRGDVEMEAARMFDALYRWGDVDMLIKHAHPKLIQATGGELGARRAFEELIGDVQASGMRVESFAVLGTTELVATEYSDFAIVPSRGVFRLANGARIAIWSYQLAARKKGEQKWGFVDGSRLNADNLWVLFPDFPKNQRLPRCVETTLEDPAAIRRATGPARPELR